MPNLLIVYDDEDPKIGTNSLMCYTHLQDNVSFEEHTVISFDGITCTCENIENAISELQQAPFIFVAYSHGNDDCLRSHYHGEYVNIGNSYFFGDSLFYTNACSTAQLLKGALLEQNCRVYIGYSDQVLIPDSPDLENLFIKCENHAITLFLNTDLTIGECFREMKDLYDRICDTLIDQGNIAWASRLSVTRGDLIIGGDEETTRSSYM